MGRTKEKYASMAEWSIAPDCKSGARVATLVRIQLGAQPSMKRGFGLFSSLWVKDIFQF